MFGHLTWNLFGGKARGETDGETHEAAGEAAGGDDEPAPWVSVLTAFDVVQATIATARLHDEGIPARLRQEGANSALPVNAGLLSRIDVMVPEPLADKASAVLADVLPELPDENDDDLDESP